MPGLGQWVKYLKKQHRLNLLDPSRVTMLNGIDFDWKWGRKEGEGDDNNNNGGGGGANKKKNQEDNNKNDTSYDI